MGIKTGPSSNPRIINEQNNYTWDAWSVHLIPPAPQNYQSILKTPWEEEVLKRRKATLQNTKLDKAILFHDRAIARAIRNNHPNRKAFHEAEKQKLLAQKWGAVQTQETAHLSIFDPARYQQSPETPTNTESDVSRQRANKNSLRVLKNQKKTPTQQQAQAPSYSTGDNASIYPVGTGSFWWFNQTPQEPSTMKIGWRGIDMFSSYPLATKLGDLAPRFARGELEWQCWAGVRNILESFWRKMWVNFNIPKNWMSGKNWAWKLANNPHFVRLNVTDLSQVPPGAIIAYGPCKYGSPDRKIHWHVEVVTSDGRFAYDWVANTPGWSAMRDAWRELTLKEMWLMGVFVPKVG